MSWATHDLEPYAFQRHLGRRIAFFPLLLGSYSPDIMTKWFVYGIHVFGIPLRADNPEKFHRGWPGVGFTHSLFYGVLLAIIISLAFRNRVWGVSFMIGQWAHAISDIGDTRGTMLFFPLTTRNISIGAWQYAGETGRYIDAGAYFSGLGWVWDGVWVVMALISWRVITREYFHTTIVAADGMWSWLGRYLPEEALLAIFRASYFYGITRWCAWLIWAHVVHDYQFDLHWGGPQWVEEFARSALWMLDPRGNHFAGGGGGPG
jgi:membrane-bound metal-dependent hydrolase YbcI (DUF457 family)